MALNSSTYLLLLFFQQIYTSQAYYEKKKIISRSSAEKFELKLSLVGLLLKLFVTLPFLVIKCSRL
jgi:hypothetical protein